MENVGLTARNINIITAILATQPEVEKVIIYGSRARGDYRLGSDIDLTLAGKDLTPLILAKIAQALDDSDSPYLVDLSIYPNLTYLPLVENIRREGQLFYQRENNEINHLR